MSWLSACATKGCDDVLIIAVVGSKGSGKTTTIEVLVKGLTKQNYRVSVIKHISEPDFTLDTEGKDTWRYQRSGAQTVMTVADHEIGIMRTIDTQRLSLKQILENFSDEVDIIFLEGFKKLMSDNPNIPKIATIKSLKEAQYASKNFCNIIAFTSQALVDANKFKPPIVDVNKDPNTLINMILTFFNSKKGNLSIQR